MNQIQKFILIFSIQITLANLEGTNPLKNSIYTQPGKSGTNYTKKGGQKYLIITDK